MPPRDNVGGTIGCKTAFLPVAFERPTNSQIKFNARSVDHCTSGFLFGTAVVSFPLWFCVCVWLLTLCRPFHRPSQVDSNSYLAKARTLAATHRRSTCLWLIVCFKSRFSHVCFAGLISKRPYKGVDIRLGLRLEGWGGVVWSV